MTQSVLALIQRKVGTTPTEFYEHYENIHMPLLKELFSDVFPQSHTRYYVVRESPNVATSSSTAGATNSSESRNAIFPASMIIGDAETVDFDVAVSVVFADQAAFERFMARMAEVGERLLQDEESFTERAVLRIMKAGETRVTT